MAKKHQLRALRTGTVINITSKKQETDIIQALFDVERYLLNKFPNNISLTHKLSWYLKDIVRELRIAFPRVDFHHHFNTSCMRPDGGFFTLKTRFEGDLIYPILIAEVKNQGTNDLRLKEGLPKQAKGNAIERLGKNLIGLRTALQRESIFPFVCFGYGCDFDSESSILDRVTTMAMFGELNKTYLHNMEGGLFNRGSFYFRREKWVVDEMFNIMKDIAERSILYYFSKYGEAHFSNEE